MPGLQTAFAQGLAASRPAASSSNAGYYFLATDTNGGTLYQSNGTSWVQLAPGVSQAGLADPTTTKGDLIVHGTTTTRLGVGSDTQVLTADSTQTLGLKWAAAGAASLSVASAYLGADVSMTSANTYYDGPALSLSAGTWLLCGAVLLVTSSAGNQVTAKLWNGTSASSSAALAIGTTVIDTEDLALSGLVSPTGTTTYKISCAGTGTGNTIKAAAPNNAAGNTASYLLGIKVA